jgi:dephospho-CoA kinase
MMGSGKTTVGRVLSKSLGYYFFDRAVMSLLNRQLVALLLLRFLRSQMKKVSGKLRYAQILPANM